MSALPLLCILSMRVHGPHPILLGRFATGATRVWNFFFEFGNLIDCLTALGV
jgi:hypothetical protein